jgi:tetratricopeptide (TPR) repeat protein
LQDLNNVDVLESNNVIILQRHGDFKKMLNDYQKALKDLDKADVLEPNNAFTLRSREDVKWKLDY